MHWAHLFSRKLSRSDATAELQALRKLAATGPLRPVDCDVLDLGPPLPPAPGVPPASEILAQMRDEDR